MGTYFSVPEGKESNGSFLLVHRGKLRVQYHWFSGFFLSLIFPSVLTFVICLNKQAAEKY